MSLQMDKGKIQPIYDAVKDEISQIKGADELPGFDELYDFITAHCQFIIQEQLTYPLPMNKLWNTLQNTLYLGIIVGLIYGHNYGIPDFAIYYLKKGGKP